LAVLASAGGNRVPVTVPEVLTSEDRVRIEYPKEGGAHTHCFCHRSKKHERAPKWWTRISQTGRGTNERRIDLHGATHTAALPPQPQPPHLDSPTVGAVVKHPHDLIEF
jgi:hypothetical protein